MSEIIRIFRTPESEAGFYAAYDAVLAQWPVPYEELDIPTRFGSTHVVASGPLQAPPIFLLHCYFGTATVWYPNMLGLSPHFRCYAVDVIGEPNKSRPVRPIKNRAEFAEWLVDLFDSLQVEQTCLVGNSFGGFWTMNQAIFTPERLKAVVLISPAAVFTQVWPFFTHMLLPVMLGSEVRIQKALKWAANGVPMDDCWTRLFTLGLQVGKPASMVFPTVFRTKDLRQIQVPVWLLIGDREVVYPPEATLRKAARMMPGLKTCLVPGANHIAGMSNPEEINQRIIEAFGSVLQ